MTDGAVPEGGAREARGAGPEPSDSELMSRVRDGEIERLGELFERHHRRLFGFFLRLAGGGAAAEDLVQEVFVRMLKYRQTFRSDAEFAPWMFALARNAATDRWRGRPQELPVEPDAPEPAAATPHPLDGLVAGEERSRLRAASRAARAGEARAAAAGPLRASCATSGSPRCSDCRLAPSRCASTAR